MTDPIDDALSTIWGHPGPWSEEMRGRMAKVINATLERAVAVLEPCIGLEEINHGGTYIPSYIDDIRALKLAIPESNSTNAGEG